MNSANKVCPTTSRRVFVNILLGGIIGGLIGWLLYPIFRFLIPPKSVAQESDVVQVSLNEVPIGKSKVINYKEEPTIIIRTDNGLFALSAVCTHLGCIVQWDEINQEIVCPCHAARYDLNGNVKSGPAPRPLALAKARIVDDKILIGEA
ncbi:MAG: ubiquinol-cytochrome c reductase iron-sulfur subunit [bacterium]